MRYAIEQRAKAESIEDNGLKLESGYGFDSKTPHVGASLTLENIGLCLRIHIQGVQYRRMLSFGNFVVASKKKGKSKADIETFIQETDCWNWLFGDAHSGGSFTCTHRQGGFFKGYAKIPTSQQKGKLLLSYAPQHIYQYTNIGGDGGVALGIVIHQGPLGFVTTRDSFRWACECSTHEGRLYSTQVRILGLQSEHTMTHLDGQPFQALRRSCPQTAPRSRWDGGGQSLSQEWTVGFDPIPEPDQHIRCHGAALALGAP